MKIKSTGAPVDTTVPPYLLDNAGREAPARFGALSAMFDTGTIRHLEERGVARGWQCWEVGGGGGSIATWLARRVGLAGRVLATDIDPRFLETLKVPTLEVRRHDIVSDPLPEETFDLIHARLVLVHLPPGQPGFPSLLAVLGPGGLDMRAFGSAARDLPHHTGVIDDQACLPFSAFFLASGILPAGLCCERGLGHDCEDAIDIEDYHELA